MPAGQKHEVKLSELEAKALSEAIAASEIPKLTKDFNLELANLQQPVEQKAQPEDVALVQLIEELRKKQELVERCKRKIAFNAENRCSDLVSFQTNQEGFITDLKEGIQAVKILQQAIDEFKTEFPKLETKIHPPKDTEKSQLEHLQTVAFGTLIESLQEDFINQMREIPFDTVSPEADTTFFKQVLARDCAKIIEFLKSYNGKYPNKALTEKLDTLGTLITELKLPIENNNKDNSSQAPTEAAKPTSSTWSTAKATAAAWYNRATTQKVPPPPPPPPSAAKQDNDSEDTTRSQIAHLHNAMALIKFSHIKLIREYFEEKAKKRTLIITTPNKHPDLTAKTIELVKKWDKIVEDTVEDQRGKTEQHLKDLLKLHPEYNLICSAQEEIRNLLNKNPNHDGSSVIENAGNGICELQSKFLPTSEHVLEVHYAIEQLKELKQLNSPELIDTALSHLNKLLQLLPDTDKTKIPGDKGIAFLNEYLTHDVSLDVIPELPNAKETDFKPWLSKAITAVKRRTDHLERRMTEVVRGIEDLQRQVETELEGISKLMQQQREELERLVKESKTQTEMIAGTIAIPSTANSSEKKSTNPFEEGVPQLEEKGSEQRTSPNKTGHKKPFLSRKRPQPKVFKSPQNLIETADNKISDTNFAVFRAKARKRIAQQNVAFEEKRAEIVHEEKARFTALQETQKSYENFIQEANPFKAQYDKDTLHLDREFKKIQENIDKINEMTEAEPIQHSQEELNDEYEALVSAIGIHNNNYFRLVEQETRLNSLVLASSKESMVDLQREFERIARKKLKNWDYVSPLPDYENLISVFDLRNRSVLSAESIAVMDSIDRRLYKLFEIHLKLKVLNYQYINPEPAYALDDIGYYDEIRGYFEPMLVNDKMEDLTEKDRLELIQIIRNIITKIYQAIKKMQAVPQVEEGMPQGGPGFFETLSPWKKNKTRLEIEGIRDTLLELMNNNPPRPSRPSH